METDTDCESKINGQKQEANPAEMLHKLWIIGTTLYEVNQWASLPWLFLKRTADEIHQANANDRHPNG